MNKLKNLIVKYFAICCFGVSVVQSVVDSTFMDVLLPIYLKNETVAKELMVTNLILTFLLFFLGAYIFYCLTKKAIEAESKRQVQQQNLLYSCIAHDLKTPMTSVQGFACALKEGKIKPDEQTEILDIIYQKSCHMNELIETLFAYSKLGMDNYSLNMSSTNLCTLVSNLVAIHYSEFEDKNIELRIEIPDKPIFCQLDEKEFRRAVNNLIINAYKHNSKGASVLIRVWEEGGRAFVAISDNGEEIPKELAETMFEPFIRGDESRKSGNGSGLGLAISSLIVEKHGGKLYLENDGIGYSYTKGFVIQI